MNDKKSDLEKLIESNTKAVAALTDNIQEMKRDRDRMYGIMRNLAWSNKNYSRSIRIQK